VLNATDKLELIKTASGGNVSDSLVRFIQLVLNQKRENYLQSIALSYQDLYRKHTNSSIAKLVTACPVDSNTTNKIKQLVQQSKTGTIEFVTEIDASITGGFVLYIDSYRLDASVASQLKRIKNQLLSKNKKIA
jgi:F-type H+-transporting ATPase subunit delta